MTTEAGGGGGSNEAGGRGGPNEVAVGDLLRLRAREHPDRPFLRCADEALTYGEADERSDRVAAGLHRLGVRAGDRVATVVPNRIEMLELLFGCAKAGAVHVPVNVFLKGTFLRYQLEDADVHTIVGDAAALKAVRAVGAPCEQLVALDPDDNAVPYDEVRGCAEEAPDVTPGLEDLMALMYTSGTTGLPKGCMLSHGWHVHSAAVSREMLDYREGDCAYTALPLFHGWARGIVMGAITNRLEAVIDPAFSPSTILDRLVDVGATHFAGVGAMGMAILGMPQSDLDRSHRLRCAFMIPFPPAQQAAFEERFGVRVLSQMYGQTECGAICYAPLDGDRVPGTVGRPSPAFEVRLVDDDDETVTTGDMGEVVVRPRRPHSIYSGYWRKPDETIEAWRNLWHHTGDYARENRDGTITFVDRKSDALRRRGENVSSVELEQAIMRHPKVAEAAAVAVPAPVTEDDIKVCLVVTEAVTPEEMFAFFRDALPYFAIPRYVEVSDELPKTATMRVQKHKLRDRGVTDATWDLESLGLVVGKEDRR